MYRYCFSILGSIFLIMFLICVLPGCFESKIVENSGNISSITPTKQAAPVTPVSPEPAEIKPVQETVPPSQILFLRINSKRSVPSDLYRDIWVMDSDGSNAVDLTKGAANVTSSDWSPDKSKIVFDSSGSIYLMSSDGSSIKRVSPDASIRYLPAWSPDGSKIASSKYFVTPCNEGSCSHYQLSISNQYGEEYTPVKFSPPDGYQVLPRWFSDSQRIAYLDFETGFYEIYSGDTVTGTIHKYNIEGNSSYMPWFSLSPDETRIAYSHDSSRDYSHAGREVFLFDIPTGETIQLTNNDYADDNPCFSPDGKQIIFSSFGTTDETSGMFIMDLESKSTTKIPSQYGDMPMKWK
ncbi:MAG: hypothetical protein WB588_05780 [Dehalococcoidia bacterium]